MSDKLINLDGLQAFKEEEDALLAEKQDTLTFNPTVPSGTTPTQLTGVKDGNNYYEISGGSNLDIGYPTYDATATYAVGDVVIYDNKIYQCITSISTAEAWTAAHWQQVATSIDDIIMISANSTSGTLTDAQIAKIASSKHCIIDYYTSSSHAFYTQVSYSYSEYDSPRQYHAVFVYDNIDIGTSAQMHNRLIVVKMTSKTWSKSESSSRFVKTIAGLYGTVNVNESITTGISFGQSYLALSGKLPYLDTLPTSNNTSGFLTIVKCTSEPAAADRHEGYLYIVVPSAQ